MVHYRSQQQLKGARDSYEQHEKRKWQFHLPYAASFPMNGGTATSTAGDYTITWPDDYIEDQHLYWNGWSLALNPGDTSYTMRSRPHGAVDKLTLQSCENSGGTDNPCRMVASITVKVDLPSPEKFHVDAGTVVSRSGNYTIDWHGLTYLFGHLERNGAFVTSSRGITSYAASGRQVGTTDRYKLKSCIYYILPYWPFYGSYCWTIKVFNVKIGPSRSGTGNLTALANSCTIPSGSTSCSGSLSWNTSGYSYPCLFSDTTRIACGTSGNRTVSGITTSGKAYQLRESYINSSQLIDAVGISGVKAMTGSLTASPTTCNIQPGAEECSSSITWTSAGVSKPCIFEGRTLLQCSASGTSVSVSGITTAGKTYYLKAGSSYTSRTLASATVSGRKLRRGNLSFPQGETCTIGAGSTSCSLNVSWTSSRATNPCLFAGTRLVRCGTRRTNVAVSGIDANGTTVSLKLTSSHASETLDSRTVRGVHGKTGSISASPDRCNIVSPATSCSSRITWTSSKASNPCLFEGIWLLRCSASGTNVEVTGITTSGKTYHLKDYTGRSSTTTTLASVTVRGEAGLPDVDSDLDGVADSLDAFPRDATETVDTNGNGIGDNADLNDDGPGDIAPDDADHYPQDGSRWFDGIYVYSPGMTTLASRLSTSTVPGLLPYSAGVDDDGLAQITLPLAVTPGVNGLEPSLALTYSSGAGAEQKERRLDQVVLGYGWNLAGLSLIHRCERADINSTGLTMTNTDDLCLDGERMVAISGSKFGSSAEYRLERDDFSKITPSGSGFQVRTDDGLIHKYGINSANRVSPGGSSIIWIWALESVEDRFGNRMSVTWRKNSLSSKIFPTRISYHGVTVDFRYTSIPNYQRSRVKLNDAGTLYTRPTSYLHTIRVTANGAKVREYRLRHQSRVYGRLLDAVQVCGYSEQGGNEECLAPVDFRWHSNLTILAVDRVTGSLGAETTFDYVEWQSGEVPSLPLETTGLPAFYARNATSCTQAAHHNGLTKSYNRRAYVQGMTTADGLGGFNRWEYRAANSPRFLMENRGYAGHEVVIRRDVTEPGSEQTIYTKKNLCYPYQGVPLERIEVDGATAQGGQVMSRTQNVWSSRSLHSGKTRFVHLSEATTLDYEGSGLFSATQTDYTYSFANNVPSGLTTVTGTSASASRRAGNQWLLGTRLSRTSQAYTFQRDATNWLNGFVTNLTTTQGTGSNRKSQTLTRTPYLKGSKKTMSVGTATQSRGSAGSLTTTNVYDQWGNPTSVTTQKVGDATTSRTTRYASYANRRYPGSVTNAESEASAFTYDIRFGTPKTIRSPDGRSSAITRDGFGRVVKVDDTTSGNDRLTTVNFFEATGSVYGHDRKYMARVTDSGGPDRITYFDKLGRQVSGAVQGYNTYQWNVQDTGYDRLGRVVSESVPYQRTGLPGGHSQHAVRSTTEYDSRHRVISQRAADGGRSDYSYGMSGSNLRVGKTKKVYSGTTLESTATSYQYWNGLGQRVKTTDALGTHTTFAYDTMGNLTNSRVGSNPATTMTYDAIGQRTQIAEPHTGTTRFKWTAFGELKEQTNGAGRIVRYEYDHTGRLTRRLDDAQTGKPTTENEWTYGTSGTGKGKLTSMTQDKGNDGSNEFTETYAYDLKSGRSSSVTTTIRHSGIATQTIYSTRGYDSQGRQSSAWNDGYGTAYAYSAYGYRTHVNNTNVSPPSTLEQTRSMDAFGNPTEVKYNFNGAVTIQSFDEASGRTRSVRTDVHFANGTRTVQNLSYKWRTDGALKSRTDHLPATDLKETFTHDNLRRLTRASSRHASGTRNLDYRYDTLGNLTSKTSNVNADADVTGYTYRFHQAQCPDQRAGGHREPDPHP